MSTPSSTDLQSNFGPVSSDIKHILLQNSTEVLQYLFECVRDQFQPGAPLWNLGAVFGSILQNTHFGSPDEIKKVLVEIEKTVEKEAGSKIASLKNSVNTPSSSSSSRNVVALSNSTSSSSSSSSTLSSFSSKFISSLGYSTIIALTYSLLKLTWIHHYRYQNNNSTLMTILPFLKSFRESELEKIHRYFSGKTVLIIGCTSGVGRELAMKLIGMGKKGSSSSVFGPPKELYLQGKSKKEVEGLISDLEKAKAGTHYEFYF